MSSCLVFVVAFLLLLIEPTEMRSLHRLTVDVT